MKSKHLVASKEPKTEVMDIPSFKPIRRLILFSRNCITCIVSSITKALLNIWLMFSIYIYSLHHSHCSDGRQVLHNDVHSTHFHCCRNKSDQQEVLCIHDKRNIVDARQQTIRHFQQRQPLIHLLSHSYTRDSHVHGLCLDLQLLKRESVKWLIEHLYSSWMSNMEMPS